MVNRYFVWSVGSCVGAGKCEVLGVVWVQVSVKCWDLCGCRWISWCGWFIMWSRYIRIAVGPAHCEDDCCWACAWHCGMEQNAATSTTEYQQWRMCILFQFCRCLCLAHTKLGTVYQLVAWSERLLKMLSVILKSTLWRSRPNKDSLKYPSVCAYVRACLHIRTSVHKTFLQFDWNLACR